MSLELSSISFKVDTSELSSAITKIEQLGTAVSKLNKPVSQLEKASEDASKSVSKVAKTSTEAGDKVELLQKKLENTYKDLSQGFTKGESSILNYARSLGIAEDALKPIQEQLKLIGKLTSDPFDSAIGSIRSVTKEFEMMNHRTELASKGIILTAKQLKEYSRVADEVAAKIQSAGFDPTTGKGLSDYTKGVERLQSKYLGLASSVSDARQIEQQHQQSLKDSGKAANYLEREMQRAENALAGLNENMLISSSNRLLRFKEGLTASGVASDEAARRYQAYAKVLADTDAKRSAQSKNSREDELKYLARATSVQLGDIGVSLAGGQNPFTVMIQQGDQLRAVLNQVGGDAKEMQGAMSQAFKQIIVGFVDVGKALGTFVVGAFKDSAASITKFAGEITGVANAYEYMRYQATLASMDTDKFTSTIGKAGVAAFNSFGAAVVPFVAASLAALAASVVAVVVAFKQLSDEQSVLAKTTAQFGGVLGLTAMDAKTLTDSVSVLGVSSSKATSILAEMGKAGNLGSESFKAIATSAVDAQKYVGISVETTVKNFSDLLKDPVKVLTKFGIETGYVNAEQIKLVETLLKSGQTSEANAKAVELLQNAYVKMSAEAKGSLSGLDLALIAISSSTGTAWDTFKNSDAVITSLNAVAAVIKTVADGAAFLALGVKTVATVVAAINAPEGVSAGVAFDTMKSQLQDYVNEYQNYRKELWEGSKQNSQMSSEEKKAASEKVAAMEAQRKLEKSLGLETKDRIKELTRAQYITLSVEKERIAAGKGAIVTMDLMKDAAKKYGEEWDKAHKKSAKKEDTAGIAAMWEKVSSAVNKANQSYDEVVNGVQVYTNAQKIMIDLLDDPAFLKQPETLQKEALARLAVAHATEQQTQEVKDLWEAEKRRILSTFQSEAEVDALRIAREQRGDSEIINAQNKLELLDEELADMLLQKAIYGELTVEQKKQLEYAKIQKDYKAEELRITKLLADPKNGIDEKAAEYLRNQNYEAAAKKRQNIDQAIILENNKYEYEQRVQLAAGISSSIETALFEGGQAGSKKLRSVIEAELRKPITLFIQAFVQDIFGLNGAGDTMSKAVSAFDKVSNFLTGGATSSAVTGLIHSSVGQSLGLSTAAAGPVAPGMTAPTQATPLGTSFGQYAGMAGNAMLGYGISKTISNGYKTGLGGAVDTIGGIASAFFGPVAGLISGAVNRAFGRKLTETGIEGTFGGSQGFTGNQYTFEKGGWFRSDKTKTSALDSDIQEGLAGQFNVLRAGIALMSTSLGLGTKSIEDFTYKFKLNLMGLSEADATKKIQEEFDKVGIAIADTIPELKEYQKQGETNLDTLTRLSTSLGTVNSTFELLGFKLEDLSLAGAKAADAIVTAYGSLEAFNTKMQAYYDAFYTEDEKKAKVLSSISAALKAAGVDVGDVSTLTRDGFKKIVDELVRTKGAADPAVVALLSVAPAFASVTKSTDDAVAAAKEAAEKLAKETADKAKEVADAAKKATDDAFSALQKAVNKQKDILSSQLNTAEALASNLDNIFELLKDNVRELYAEVAATSNMQVQQAYAIISNARTTGVLPSQDILSQAIGTVRGSLDNTNYQSRYEADRARLLFANDLAALQTVAGEQLTEAQQQIKLLKDQIEQYDLILENAQEQINELRGINTSVLSVTSAVDALTAALIEEKKITDPSVSKPTQSGGFAIGGGVSSKSPNASTLSRLGNTYYGSLGTAITDTAYVDRFDSVNSFVNTLDWSAGNKDASTAALVAAAQQYGVSANEIAIATGYSRADIEALTGGQLPRFANGGYHEGGLRLVGENSPELEVTGPARYYNKDQFFDVLRSGFSGNNDNNESTEMLRAEVRAVAISTSKLQRIIDALVVPTNQGQALNVKVAV